MTSSNRGDRVGEPVGDGQPGGVQADQDQPLAAVAFHDLVRDAVWARRRSSAESTWARNTKRPPSRVAGSSGVGRAAPDALMSSSVGASRDPLDGVDQLYQPRPRRRGRFVRVSRWWSGRCRSATRS